MTARHSRGRIVHIERIQIEGGFLNGVDVSFSPGLNVVIGARGTGKTSLIELIRFASGAKSHTATSEKRSLDHATAILAGGEVGLTMRGDDSIINISRASTDGRPRSNRRFVQPMVLSQTEIETIGLSASGRLELIDGFVQGIASLATQEQHAIAAIKSSFLEMKSMENELKELLHGSDDIKDINRQADQLRAEQSAMMSGSTELDRKREQISVITHQISGESLREESLRRVNELTNNWARRLSSAVDTDFGIDVWSGPLGDDPLISFREAYRANVRSVSNAAAGFAHLRAQAEHDIEQSVARRAALETKSRSLRAELEQQLTGASAVSRQLSHLENRIAHLQAKSLLAGDRSSRLAQLREKRDERLNELYQVRQDRFMRRNAIIKYLNSSLRPNVRISAQQFGQHGDYSRALSDAMKGSGLRYADLSALISERIPPQELLSLIESDDFYRFSSILEVPRDRAIRVLAHLRDADVAALVTSSLEDSVTFMLLDGVDFKSVEHLSAGQRCTVILSIVMQHTDRVLVLDQPEDHLDNAYIASTVIKSILKRGKDHQLILATHNANIPVLGQADLIIELTSDGQRGTVEVCKPLDDPEAVNAISNVMEGGKQAFNSRSAFYNKHSEL